MAICQAVARLHRSTPRRHGPSIEATLSDETRKERHGKRSFPRGNSKRGRAQAWRLGLPFRRSGVLSPGRQRLRTTGRQAFSDASCRRTGTVVEQTHCLTVTVSNGPCHAHETGAVKQSRRTRAAEVAGREALFPGVFRLQGLHRAALFPRPGREASVHGEDVPIQKSAGRKPRSPQPSRPLQRRNRHGPISTDSGNGETRESECPGDWASR